MNKLTIFAASVAMAMAVGGCGSDTFVVEGKVTSVTLTEGNQLAVVWSADTVTYKYGGGTISGDSFDVTIDEEAPPAAALFDPQLGIGVVRVLEDGTTLADGALDKSSTPTFAGGSNLFVIWRGEGAASFDWANNFEAGYSCGRCVPQTGKDTIEPTPCDAMEVSDVGLTCNFN